VPVSIAGVYSSDPVRFERGELELLSMVELEGVEVSR